MFVDIGRSWTLQDAKNRFSELVRIAIETGVPQLVKRNGAPAVVIVPYKDFEALRAPQRPPQTVAAFLEASPLADLELPARAKADQMRPLKLLDD